MEFAQFRSGRFRPALPEVPEVCQVNPRVYGAELAYWLGAALAARGDLFAKSSPFSGGKATTTVCYFRARGDRVDSER